MQFRKEGGCPARITSRDLKNFSSGPELFGLDRVLPPYGVSIFRAESIMGRRSGRSPSARAHREPWGRTPEFEPFLCPEAAFSDPFEVVGHPELGMREKRAILARWLARICASEAALGLKWMPQADGAS